MIAMRKCGIGRNDRGNVAMVFALAVIPLFICIGCAVDYVRATNAQATLQSAADAAVLAAGASEKVTDEEVKALVNQYLAGNKYDLKLKAVDGVIVTNGASGGDISVHVAGDVGTTFMSLAGYTRLDISADTGIKRGAGAAPIELVLALDSTGSMAGTKLDTLKTAAKSLVTGVLSKSKTSKIGIVPFGGHVNVGLSRRGEPWLSVKADYTDTYCWDEYPQICTGAPGTCYADGVPYTCTISNCVSDTSVPPTHYCVPSNHAWGGCVGSRLTPDNDNNNNVASVPYPGLMDVSCNTEITDLTDDQAKLLADIDKMFADYDTFIPGGLLWGWNMLTPEAPLTSAQAMADITSAGGKKALVLMTDGANTLHEVGESHWSCGGECTDTNALTSQLCESIKAEGIILYTVLFDVTDPKIQAMLDSCASDPSKAFVASDNAALLAAFGKIGKSLGQLRLSQ
jgi:Flp pilus assembly protein TadG